jgi:hypothetical protein
MEMINLHEELLTFFKAMADANRLRIIGLLSIEPYTVEQLASLLDLRPSTISHHLSRLSEAGLVSARTAGYYRQYHLQPATLEEMARRLLSKEELRGIVLGIDLEAYERDVLDHYSLPNGRLKNLPAQWKKRQAIMRHIAKSFAYGVRYSEAEINQRLLAYHEDTATIRREMVGEGLLQREGGTYWRPYPDQSNQHNIPSDQRG